MKPRIWGMTLLGLFFTVAVFSVFRLKNVIDPQGDLGANSARGEIAVVEIRGPISVGMGQRILRDDGVQLVAGDNHDGNREPEPAADGGFERGCDFAIAPRGAFEYGISAVQQRADTGEAQILDDAAKIGHGDALRTTHIDAAEQSDTVRHGCSLANIVWPCWGGSAPEPHPLRDASL